METTNDYTGTDNLEVMAEAVNYNAYLLDLVRRQARADQRIVDFGAGIGTFARTLAAEGLRVLCIEPDARQAAAIAGAGLEVAPSLDEVADDSIDFLYTLNVLEHIEDDAAVLRLMHAKLKPGGRLLVYVPAFQVLYSSMDRKVGHVRRYRRRDLAARVAAAGFRVERARYADAIGFFASLAYRFAGNDQGTLNRRALVLYDRVVFPLSRALDVVAWPFFGKNALVLARK